VSEFVREALLFVGSFAGVALVGAVASGLLWLTIPAADRRLLPVRLIPERACNGGEVVLCFGVALFGAMLLVWGPLSALGFYEWLYGKKVSVDRQALWVVPLSTPLAVVLVLLILRATKRLTPQDIGATWSRGRQNAVVGYLVWLFLTPVVLAVYGFCQLFTRAEQHSLSMLAESDPTVVEWLLLAFQAIVSAALIEELLFRGVLLSWLRQATNVGHVMLAGLTVLLTFNAMLLTPEEQARRPGEVKPAPPHPGVSGAVPGVKLGMPPPNLAIKKAGDTVALARFRGKSMLTKSADLGAARPYDSMAWELRPGLVVFQATVLALYLWCVQRQRGRRAHPNNGLAILGSAILFAAFHSVWPHQIPLFVLGLGLGWLACRTNSLVGVMVVHALFNGVPCVFLFVQRGIAG